MGSRLPFRRFRTHGKRRAGRKRLRRDRQEGEKGNPAEAHHLVALERAERAIKW
jgi:hypothetical protein